MNNYKKDLYRYGGLTGFLGFYKGFLFPGFVYTYFFRKASNSIVINGRIISREDATNGYINNKV